MWLRLQLYGDPRVLSVQLRGGVRDAVELLHHTVYLTSTQFDTVRCCVNTPDGVYSSTMTLKEFFTSLSPSERIAFAARCDTSDRHIRNIAFYGKTCGEYLAINIERESNRKVRCEDLRPDVDWQFLRGTKKAACKNDAGSSGAD